MGRLWALRAPGEGLFLRLAALMMFFARRRWLALESRLLTTGDTQQLSLGVWMGEATEDVCTGLVAGKDSLVWESPGDCERKLHGGEAGDVDVSVGLDVETEITGEAFWLGIGDWHLEPHGGEHGDVVVEVWNGLNVAGDWFVGEWHLEPQGGEKGAVFEVWDGLKPGTGETLDDRGFWVVIGD